jgi:hypothetical protein
MKPVTGLSTFANTAPPWSLPNLDADIAALQSAINDLGTYSNPLLDTSGSANTITVAQAGSLTFTLAFGLLIYVKVANTTTSSTVNINLNSGGNVIVSLPSGAPPAPGQFVAGGVYAFIYDAASPTPHWQLFSQLGTVGTFTTTLSGPYSSNPSGTLTWEREGALVSLYCNTAITGTTSSANSISASGLPAAITPSVLRIIPCLAYASGYGNGYVLGYAQVNTSNTITIALLSIAATNSPIIYQNFPAASTAGLPQGWAITYSL